MIMNKDFSSLLPVLSLPEFLNLAQSVGVNIWEESKEEGEERKLRKDFEALAEEINESYIKLPRNIRRRLLIILNRRDSAYRKMKPETEA